MSREDWKELQESGVDLRWYKPPKGKERYWVALDDGSELELSLKTWARVERGDAVSAITSG